jgi:hypothetical protein
MNARYGLAIQVSSSCAVKLMQPGPGGVVRLAARFDALHMQSAPFTQRCQRDEKRLADARKIGSPGQQLLGGIDEVAPQISRFCDEAHSVRAVDDQR